MHDKIEGARFALLTLYVVALLADLKVAHNRLPAVPCSLRASPDAAAQQREAWRQSPWVFAKT